MKLSVAMCTYNGVQDIRKQLESIINQLLNVDEIIVCDDGSTDNTLVVVYEFANLYTNIKWHIEQNSHSLGVKKNFEKAINLCSEDIIFLADQDDVWRNDKTKVIVDFLEQNPKVNVVFTDADFIGTEGELLTRHSLLDAACLLPNMRYWVKCLRFEIFAECNRATGATMAFRRSFISQFMPISDHIGLHDEQIAMAAIVNDSIGLIPEKLISYRLHASNVVGIPKYNWIYTNRACPDLLDLIVVPRYKEDYVRFKDMRVTFYKLRSLNTRSLAFKLKLTLLWPFYLFLYRRYWWHFFLFDVFPSLRLKLCKHSKI